MRVITGTARGKRLKELKGQETRPTSDRLKESVFNILQFELEGRQVLDLFAGTGQLGIEALSRGAARAVFVDSRREAAGLVKENLTLTGLEQRGQVHCRDALAYLAGCREKFDLVLLDPPYGGPLLERALEALTRFDILREHGIILCESAADRELPDLASPYALGRVYRYGNVKLTTYRRQGSDQIP